MTISDLVPTLQPMVEDLSQQLRFVCYFILTAAIVVRTGRGGASIGRASWPMLAPPRPVLTTMAAVRMK